MRIAILSLMSICAGFGAPATDPRLAAVFQKMDQAAAGFKGARGDVKRFNHQDLINADSTSTGTVAVRRAKPHELEYLLKLHETDPPRESVVALNAKRLQIYHPAINTVDEGELTKQLKAKAEQFLVLGFGTSSHDLETNYTVTFGDEETIDGQKTTRLDLVPKSQEVLQMYKKISMWVSDATGQAVQLKLIQPGLRDYEIDTYTNMKFGDVPASDVKLDLPKNVKFEPIH